MDSISKIDFDFDKNKKCQILLLLSKENLVKNSHFLHFETLSLDYKYCKKVTKTNFEFKTTFIL